MAAGSALFKSKFVTFQMFHLYLFIYFHWSINTQRKSWQIFEILTPGVSALSFSTVCFPSPFTLSQVIEK